MENSSKSVLGWLLSVKFNEIYIRDSDAQKSCLFKEWVYIVETTRVQGTKKYLNNAMVHGGNFFKISLTWLLCIKFKEIYMRYSDTQ